MITYQQIESMVLLQRLTGMGLVECAYAVIPNFDHTDFASTAALTIQIVQIEKRLDEEFNQAHS
jgi:hypothetical protein